MGRIDIDDIKQWVCDDGDKDFVIKFHYDDKPVAIIVRGANEKKVIAEVVKDCGYDILKVSNVSLELHSENFLYNNAYDRIVDKYGDDAEKWVLIREFQRLHQDLNKEIRTLHVLYNALKWMGVEDIETVKKDVERLVKSMITLSGHKTHEVKSDE